MTTAPPLPKGLSPKSRAIWKALTTEHAFETYEHVAFERSLRWFDKADDWLAAAEGAQGREAQQFAKQAMDAATAGLRFWRLLRFTEGVATRRPGRPSDDDWSPQRRLQAMNKAG